MAGPRPPEIVAITFTNRAAAEMKIELSWPSRKIALETDKARPFRQDRPYVRAGRRLAPHHS